MPGTSSSIDCTPPRKFAAWTAARRVQGPPGSRAVQFASSGSVCGTSCVVVTCIGVVTLGVLVGVGGMLVGVTDGVSVAVGAATVMGLLVASRWNVLLLNSRSS